MRGPSPFIRGLRAAGLIVALQGAAWLTVAQPAAAQAAATDAAPGDPGTAAGPAAAPGAVPDPQTAAVLAEDIRDIRGPKFVLPAWAIPALIAAVVLLALAVYGVWAWFKRRRRPRALTLSEAALKRLEDIRPLMQPASVREFSIAASDIVRQYTEQRFDVTATHRTTEEFLRDLLESAPPALARHRGLLAEFLEQCDLVKFAGISLSLTDMESLHQSACTFVIETSKPEPAPSTPAAPDAPAAPRPGTPEEAHDTLPTA